MKKDVEEAQNVLTSSTAQPEDSEKENETDSEENSPELIEDLRFFFIFIFTV